MKKALVALLLLIMGGIFATNFLRKKTLVESSPVVPVLPQHPLI
jgi:hypothetical protein